MDIISYQSLLYAFIPVAMVALITFLWSQKVSEVGVSVLRMVVQLLLIGYVLAWLFEQKNLGILLLVLSVMALASTWISLRKVPDRRRKLFVKTLIVITISSLFILGIVVMGVLSSNPVENLRIVIPLAGMIFSSAMTAVSLAVERFYAEHTKGAEYTEARNTAFNTSLIPITNSMLAVGLVALPGMMTGQILSGVSPDIAVRYQIVVMCMIFGVGGLASAGFLKWVVPNTIQDR